MQIKKFESKNMAGALRLIRSEFGEDAVILSARTITKEKGLFGAVRNVGVEVTAAKDAQPESGIAQTADAVKDTYTRSGQGAYPARSVVNAGRNFTPVMTRQVTSPVNRVSRQHNGISSLTARLMSVKKGLVKAGVENKTVASLMDLLPLHTRIEGNVRDGDLRAGLLLTLKNMGLDGDAIQACEGRRKIAALVGRPGDGKTETIAKLAGTQLCENEKRVAFVSLDCHRVAANAQLKTYAKIFDIPFAGVSNAPELVKAIETFKDKTLVLVDTPGLTEVNINGLIETLAHAKENCRLEIFPVVNALTREDLSIQMLKRLEPLSPSGMIISKSDACKPLGAVLNITAACGVPVCHYTCGQRVPEDIRHNCMEMLVKGLFPENGRDKKTVDHVKIVDQQTKKPTRTVDVAPKGFIASVHSDVYHASSCKLAVKIKNKNRVELKSEAEARQRGLIPCGFCMHNSVEVQRSQGRKELL